MSIVVVRTALLLPMVLLTACMPPLHQAASQGDVNAVKAQLQQGANINEWASGTALMFAAREGHADVVTLLVDKGADVNTGNQAGDTPLGLAAQHGHVAVVNILLDGAADSARATAGLERIVAANSGDPNFADRVERCQNGIRLIEQEVKRREAAAAAEEEAAEPAPLAAARGRGRAVAAAPDAAPPATDSVPDAPPVGEAVAGEIPQEEPAEDYASSEPPEPEYEEPPPAPAVGEVWIPGWWDWGDGEWRWVMGRWVRPMAGRSYVAPHYEVAGGRVVLVRGYWGVGKPPLRSYGGTRIKFVRPTKPEGYRPGAAPALRASAGVAVGTRSKAAYVSAGPARTPPRSAGSAGRGNPPGTRASPAPPHRASPSAGSGPRTPPPRATPPAPRGAAPAAKPVKPQPSAPRPAPSRPKKK
jgi:hypothetical protein